MRGKPKRERGLEPRRRERLIALSLLGVLLFNYPMLDLFGGGATVFGVPLLFLYVFVVWAVFLWLVARILEHAEPGDSDPQD